MTNKLFRKVSLDRLSSPEQLDNLITVVDPKGIFALIGFLGIMIVLIIWGIWGSISTTVYGTAVLLRTGGVLSVSAHVSGRISDISIEDSDLVSQGDVVARVEQTDLLRELFSARKEDTASIIKEKKQLTLNKRKQSDLEKRLEFYKQRLTSQENLFKQGLVTKQSVLETEDEILKINDTIKQLNIEASVIRQEATARQRQIQFMIDRFKANSTIISPYSGRILEVSTNHGQLINPGDVIFSMELSGKHIKSLEAVIYVPLGEGKRVRRGMRVNLSPSTVHKEEYGTLIARVHTVSPYPATAKEMMSILQNQSLVTQITQSGPQIAIFAHLIPDAHNISGFEWTSSSGPPIKLDSGTLADTSITIDKQRPISLVIPLLKRVFSYE